MPTLDESTDNDLIKLLNIGESGTGKTGQLASLALAGYNLWILDYDAGLATKSSLKDVLKSNPEARKRVTFKTLRDDISIVNGLPRWKAPTHAYKDAGKTLVEWEADKFTPKDILVVDTLTSFSNAAFNEGLSANGRLNQRPQLLDYGWCADSVTLFIEMLTSPQICSHVIVNSHIKTTAADEDSQTPARGLPNAKGQEISRVASRYFNNVILSRSIGAGPGAKRQIVTTPQGIVEVKTCAPISVKPTYPIESGLADLFRDILGHGPTPNFPAKATSPEPALAT